MRCIRLQRSRGPGAPCRHAYGGVSGPALGYQLGRGSISQRQGGGRYLLFQSHVLGQQVSRELLVVLCVNCATRESCGTVGVVVLR